MKIEIKKFGRILNSHPTGKDAFSSAIAYIVPSDTEENIELDFSGVEVLTPSWADEFVTKLVEKYPEKVTFINTENSSVKATLQILNLIT